MGTPAFGPPAWAAAVTQERQSHSPQPSSRHTLILNLDAEQLMPISLCVRGRGTGFPPIIINAGAEAIALLPARSAGPFFQTMATFGREPLPPAFPCPICLNECYPWRNPVLLETDEKACEHHLCGEPYCWEELKSGRKSGRSSASDALQNLKDDPAPTPRDTRVLCPSCKGNVVGAIKFEEWSAFGKRQYLNFKVQCPRWKSCGWEGAMSEVEAHLSKCQAFRCEHCQAQVKERGMELFRPVERIWKDQHDETCPDYLVKCEPCPAFEGTRDALARHTLSSTQEHLRLAYLHSHGPIPERSLRPILRSILSALAYLQTASRIAISNPRTRSSAVRKRTHRTWPSPILTRRWCAPRRQTSSSRRRPSRRSRGPRSTSPLCRTPEIVRGAAYGSEVDFGDLYASIELGRWGGLPAGFSVAFRDLVGRMLEVDQRGRVTTAEALAHLWFWLVWESRGGGRHQGPTGAGAWVTFDEGTGELRCVAA